MKDLIMQAVLKRSRGDDVDGEDAYKRLLRSKCEPLIVASLSFFLFSNL